MIRNLMPEFMLMFFQGVQCLKKSNQKKVRSFFFFCLENKSFYSLEQLMSGVYM